MPLKVRIKVSTIILGLVLANLLLYQLSTVAGLIFSLITILGIEMYYPRLNFFGDCILDVKKAGTRKVCLSFDDGPSPHTKQILEILKEKKVRANFFFLGANIERHPEIAQQASKDGHQIGLHGQSHTKLHLKGSEFIRRELGECLQTFQKYQIKYSPLFRFPHGLKNFFGVKEVERRGWKLCAWGRGVWDSKKPGVDLIVERSLMLKAGEILLLHDGDGTKENPDRSQTVSALPAIIDGLHAKGLEFTCLQDS